MNVECKIFLLSREKVKKVFTLIGSANGGEVHGSHSWSLVEFNSLGQ